MARYINADELSADLEHKKRLMERGNSYQTTLIAHTIGCIQEDVEKFPNADVAPVRHAHWIKKGVYRDGVFYKCSACPRGVFTDDGISTVKDFPYCHCGARMDEGVE